MNNEPMYGPEEVARIFDQATSPKPNFPSYPVRKVSRSLSSTRSKPRSALRPSGSRRRIAGPTPATSAPSPASEAQLEGVAERIPLLLER